MTDLADGAADRLPWTVWIGATLLIGLSLYEMATGDGVKPRYPIGLIALALSSVARTEAERTGSARLGRLADGLMGAAVGLMVGGFL